MHIDVFNQDAFSMLEMTAALNKADHKPSWLGGMGIFEPYPIRTTTFDVEKIDDKLSLVATSPRGAPIKERTDERADIRNFRTFRIALSSTLYADEIQQIREFGTETEVKAAAKELLKKQAKLRNDIELTWERMRLGAIQGKVLDANGVTVLQDWYALWGIAEPAVIDYALGTDSTATRAIRKISQNVVRSMQRSSKGSWVPGQTRVIGLCDDNFYDKLVNNPEVVSTFANWEAAASLRQGKIWDLFDYGEILWMNYRGTDDNSTVAVSSDNSGKVKFFPWKANEVFQHVMAPGEGFDMVNTPGQMWYTWNVIDRDTNAWVRNYVASYMSFICLRPEMLRQGQTTN